MGLGDRQGRHCVGAGFAFQVPLHLTGFFFPVYGEREELTGSLGAGLVIEPGLRCIVERGEGIWFEGRPIIGGPAHSIYEDLGGGFSITLSGQCTPGAGYAFSAASSLAVAACFALSGRLDVLDAAQMAHTYEVRHRTGLGDVLAIWDGYGLVMRRKPGSPGIGEVESIKLADKIAIITSELGRLPTENLLSAYHNKIVETGVRMYQEFLREPTLDNFLRLSNRFSRELGLVDEKVDRVIRPLEHHIIGWYVKKRVLVIVAEEAEVGEVSVNIAASLPIVRVFKPGEVEWRRYLKTILDTSRS